jgi:TetR/AcrR family transcriptional regulator
MKIELTTEEKIYEAAREIFYRKGLDGARMQEIADLAGINKALLHYYYRSKEKLFGAIVKRATDVFFPVLFSTWNVDIPFEAKIYTFTERYINFLIKHPFIPNFVINLIHQNPDKIKAMINFDNHPISDQLEEQIRAEIEAGNIRDVDWRQIIISIISLSVFPFIGSPMLKIIFKLDDKEFLKIMEERKLIIPKMIMAWLKVE